MMATVTPRELQSFLRAATLELDDGGRPISRVVVVDLDDDQDVHTAAESMIADLLMRSGIIAVGRATRAAAPRMDALIRALTCTITPRPRTAAEIGSVQVDEEINHIMTAVDNFPRAASTLAALLRISATRTVREALVVESLGYSMLLAGPEFAAWRAHHPPRARPAADGPAVQVVRTATTLEITLARRERRNAFDREIRDGLVDALDVALADEGVNRVVLRGAGPAFCSGGDLDEFGTAPDAATAHLVRMDRSVGARVYELADRCRAIVHGACIGAGVEIPAFAGHVVARPDAYFQLPELAMGLIPGAGGTVSLPRRIGRWRTAYIALTGVRLSAATAYEWGLVDDIVDDIADDIAD